MARIRVVHPLLRAILYVQLFLFIVISLLADDGVVFFHVTIGFDVLLLFQFSAMPSLQYRGTCLEPR